MAHTINQALAEDPLAILVPREHTDYGECDIPYYDEELDVAQGHPQGDMVGVVSPDLEECLPEGWSKTTDNPIWVVDPETGKQKTAYPDFAALAIPLEERSRAMATDVRLVIEIVTTSSKAKENKDTKTNKILYHYNRIPEFILLYPDLDDDRNMLWFVWEPSGYVLMKAGQGGRYHSRQVKGLAIKPLPRMKWRPGRKVEFYIHGMVLKPRAEIRAEKERERAEKEQALNRVEKERAEKERERAEKEQALNRVEKERAEKEQALNRVEEERAEKERLLELLSKAGIDPNAP